MLTKRQFTRKMAQDMHDLNVRLFIDGVLPFVRRPGRGVRRSPWGRHPRK